MSFTCGDSELELELVLRTKTMGTASPFNTFCKRGVTPINLLILILRIVRKTVGSKMLLTYDKIFTELKVVQIAINPQFSIQVLAISLCFFGNVKKLILEPSPFLLEHSPHMHFIRDIFIYFVLLSRWADILLRHYVTQTAVRTILYKKWRRPCTVGSKIKYNIFHKLHIFARKYYTGITSVLRRI